MSTYRARSMCPSCSSEEEVWYHNGKIQPVSTIPCYNCKTLYDPEDFILCLLDLRQNTTVSSVVALSTFTL
jgi:hypothetical protein